MSICDLFEGNSWAFDGLIAPLPLKIFDFVGFNGAINDFFGGSGVMVSPKLAQDERKRIIP